MTNIEKSYQPQSIEQHWYHTWENAGYFAPQGSGTPYCIMLPPPNVTGSLHMGHGFGFTLMDVMVRYHRMCGDKTLWQPGTDHASIATQMVVERQLNALGQSRHDLGRDAFLEKVWEWKEQSGNTITRQLRRLGASLDWSRERFTMDPLLTKAVNTAFVQLYDEGLIYRGERLVNWDPQMQTAISDLEVINEEADGKLWHIRYPLSDSTGQLIVATTRPETLLGDVAVAVHPDDERYSHLIGKTLQLPLTDKVIPIIADDYVDPTFGSGCVKITPAHDFNDYAVGARHQLKPINIFTADAHLNENVPEKYRGLDRFKAREQLLQDLTAADLIEKIENHQLKIPRGEKSGAIIEPYLTHQWFIKMKPLAEPAIKAVENGEIRFIPENWQKTYFQWMHYIEDWCISRQLWWGHRIPIWHDEAGNTYTGLDEADARARNHLSTDLKLTQDNDVLDTWFSSGLWPFATLGWPEKTIDLSTFFPTQVLMTGFDIIFFWVARMIFFSLKFTGQVPFHEVYITGLIRDAEGQKMSKTKGNVLDPIDLIDGIDLPTLIKKRTYGLMQPSMTKKIETATSKEFPEGITSYGTDALRFTFCSLASYTREIRFDTNRLSGYRHFCNKLWNAARYVSMQFEAKNTTADIPRKAADVPRVGAGSSPDIINQWIVSRLQQTIAAVHEALKQYRFDLLAHALYDFTWNEFCDWYLELSKPVLTGKINDAALQHATRATLASVLETLLRALHPIIPFITEDIWQRIAPLAGTIGDTIMLAPYPLVDRRLINEQAEASIDWLKQIITAIRNLRSEMNIAPGKLVAILFRNGNAQDQAYCQSHHTLLLTLAKLENITWLGPTEAPPHAASAFVGELEIFVPLAGLINIQEEKTRLQKEIAKQEKELATIQAKLANPQFVERAPAAVIDKEKDRLKNAQMALKKLKSQLLQL